MEVRDRILFKANEICRRVGFRAMTLDDICSQISISKKTFYQYFRDKDTLVEAIIQIEINKSKDDFVKISAQAENAIHEMILSHETMAEDMKDTSPILIHDLQKFHYTTFEKLLKMKDEYFQKIVATNLNRGIEEGLYEKNINIDILAKIRIENTMLPFRTDIFPSDKYDYLFVNEVMLFHFVKGIATKKGKKLLAKYEK